MRNFIQKSEIIEKENKKNLSIFKILKFSDIIKKLNIIVDKAKKP